MLHSAMIATSEVQLPSGRFTYLSAGDGGAPAIICLHGFPDHARSWEPVMKILAEAGYRAIAPFSRGYSPSTLQGPYDVERLQKDVIELADCLSPNRPVALVGHDWGAITTMGILANRDTAKRVHCAVTMAVPHPLSLGRNASLAQLRRSWYMFFFQLPTLPEYVVKRSDYSFVDRLWRAWSPNYQLSAERRAALHQTLAASNSAPLDYYRALFQPPLAALKRARQGELLKESIDVPTRHIHGARDGCIAAKLADGQERFYSGPSDTQILPDAGHFLALEKPCEVAQLVIEWLQRYPN